MAQDHRRKPVRNLVVTWREPIKAVSERNQKDGRAARRRPADLTSMINRFGQLLEESKIRITTFLASTALIATLIITLGINAAPGKPILKEPPANYDATQTIDIGIHIKNISSLSLKDKTFLADGWFWLKWPEHIQKLIESNNIDLAEIVEFINLVEPWDSQIELDGSEPTLTSQGRYFQGYRFSGKFYQEEMDLRRFPFQSISLPLTMETRPASFSMEGEAILLKPEVNTKTILGDYISFNGYRLTGASISPKIHTYRTTFGEENAESGGSYSAVTFAADYKTDTASAIYQYIIPWLIVMTIIVLAPNLDGKMGEVRLAIPSTMLLTLVFLQQGARENIPPLEYTTFLDKIYLFGFIASLSLFSIFVWSSNLYDNHPADQHKVITRKIDRVDTIFQVSTVFLAAAIFIASLS
jgi:hypothetical protein